VLGIEDATIAAALAERDPAIDPVPLQPDEESTQRAFRHAEQLGRPPDPYGCDHRLASGHERRHEDDGKAGGQPNEEVGA
jgi:hypothetical protein